MRSNNEFVIRGFLPPFPNRGEDITHSTCELPGPVPRACVTFSRSGYLSIDSVGRAQQIARAAKIQVAAPSESYSWITTPSLAAILRGAGYRTALEGEQRMALFCTDYSLRLVGLRDRCWKYLCEMDSGRSKLFDLCEDAFELKDLSGHYPERVAAYRAHVMRWSSAQRALIANQPRGS